MLEFLMNHIGIYEEDMMGYSVGSSDGITYWGGTCGFISGNSFIKSPDAEVGGASTWSMKIISRRRMCFNLM